MDRPDSQRDRPSTSGSRRSARPDHAQGRPTIARDNSRTQDTTHVASAVVMPSHAASAQQSVVATTSSLPSISSRDAELIARDAYGLPGEGIHVRTAALQNDSHLVLRLGRQYLRRHYLASAYIRNQEGAEVTHVVGDAAVTFPIRTAPGYTRVTAASGEVTIVEDHDSLVTEEQEEEWQRFLREHRLPVYAFTAEHLATLDVGRAEAMRLGLRDSGFPLSDGGRGSQDTALTRSYLYNRAVTQLEVGRFLDRRGDRAFLNMPWLPEGQGRWLWVSPADADAAHALVMGIVQPSDVAVLREAHLLPLSGGPNVMWIPEHRLFNPLERPDGRGRFEFHTQTDRDLANLNYGGQVLTEGFVALPARPSAQLIWAIQQNVRVTRIRTDILDINVVWVPEGEQHDIADQNALDRGDLHPGAVPRPQIDFDDATAHLGGMRPDNGDPGGLYDQTAPPHPKHKPVYEIVDFGLGPRSRLVIDRATVKKGFPEPHKFKLWSEEGLCEWPDYREADWEDAAMIKRLNKWREHAFSRLNLAPKAQKSRPGYTAEQLEWLLKEHELNRVGDKPFGGPEALHKRYSHHFWDQQPRTKGALVAEWIRMHAAGVEATKAAIERRKAQEEKAKAAKSRDEKVIAEKDDTAGQEDEGASDADRE